MPFVAVLRGVEVLHASAVVMNGRAIALVGPSGAGKSSAAIQLILRGAQFLTDDVLAIESGPAGVVAHPGARVASVRHDVLATFTPRESAGLGRFVGRDDDGVRLVVDGHPEQAELAAIYFLRGDSAEKGRAVEELSPVDPRVLLASTYNLVVRTPERLRDQLDVCARIAGTVRCFAVPRPAADDVGATGSLVYQHASSLVTRS